MALRRSLLPWPGADTSDDARFYLGVEKATLFNTSEDGLTEEEAASRLLKFGKNQLPEKEDNKLLKLASEFVQPMPLMIWAAIFIEARVGTWERGARRSAAARPSPSNPTHRVGRGWAEHGVFHDPRPGRPSHARIDGDVTRRAETVRLPGCEHCHHPSSPLVAHSRIALCGHRRWRLACSTCLTTGLT